MEVTNKMLEGLAQLLLERIERLEEENHRLSIKVNKGFDNLNIRINDLRWPPSSNATKEETE